MVEATASLCAYDDKDMSYVHTNRTISGIDDITSISLNP